MNSSQLEGRRWSALQHPLWWGALALLLVNDHLLKGAGLLPSFLTGKLSDFAGLLVAPVLLVVLLGARSRRAMAWCFALVAVGFGVLQWPSVASSVGGLTARLGVPWYVTPDPTDLVALSALFGAWWLVRLEATSVVRSWAPAVRGAAVVVGACACVATSALPAPHSPVPGQPELMNADAYLHNATGAAVGVHVRMLGEHADVSCQDILEEPRRTLRRDLFTHEGVWTQMLDENAAMWPIQARNEAALQRGCYAVMLELEDSEAFFVAWSAELEVVPVPRVSSSAELGAGALIVERDGEEVVVCGKAPLIVFREGD
ncbi:MAG: hypothetical protein CO108_05455 [Deltaproteobacteria bacterium CG_4_9_14_3_um_filter_63_12]|nr:MAG: hypothetical protein CO108_05455 [Deltaproteobacteria bacterium CG_4_9_14_3_um_filter_63_12]